MSFKSWSYLQARLHLWPEVEIVSNWSPGELPPASNRKEIDLEVAKLIAAPRPPSMRSATEVPSFVKVWNKPLLDNAIVRGAEFNTFCPFREVRAHWIPFALQVARFEAGRLAQRRGAGDPELHIRRVLVALRAFCRHDEHTLARVDRPLLAAWDVGRDLRPDLNEEIRKLPLETVVDVDLTEEEEQQLMQPLSVHVASSAKRAALEALREIEATLEAVRRTRRQYYIPRADFAEWRVSFASTLGFAWRRFTGREPSGAPGSAFIEFVGAAYQSLEPERDVPWDRPCRIAVERCGTNFFQIDTDPSLMNFTQPIWAEILGITPEEKMTAMREINHRAVRAVG